MLWHGARSRGPGAFFQAALQAFTLMVACYLIRPVREALILTEDTAELRSCAVGVPLFLLLMRRQRAA